MNMISFFLEFNALILQVNGRRLLGLNHVEVVYILKELPTHVRIVCARRPGHQPPCPIDTSQDKNAFAARVSTQ